MKKLLLTLGSAAAVAAPLATVVACGSGEQSYDIFIFTGKTENITEFRAAADDFNKLYEEEYGKKLNINIVAAGNGVDSNQSLATMMIRNVRPDVITSFGVGDIKHYVDNGDILEVDVENDADLAWAKAASIVDQATQARLNEDLSLPDTEENTINTDMTQYGLALNYEAVGPIVNLKTLGELYPDGDDATTAKEDGIEKYNTILADGLSWTDYLAMKSLVETKDDSVTNMFANATLKNEVEWISGFHMANNWLSERNIVGETHTWNGYSNTYETFEDGAAFAAGNAQNPIERIGTDSDKAIAALYKEYYGEDIFAAGDSLIDYDKTFGAFRDNKALLTHASTGMYGWIAGDDKEVLDLGDMAPFPMPLQTVDGVYDAAGTDKYADVPVSNGMLWHLVDNGSDERAELTKQFLGYVSSGTFVNADGTTTYDKTGAERFYNSANSQLVNPYAGNKAAEISGQDLTSQVVEAQIRGQAWAADGGATGLNGDEVTLWTNGALSPWSDEQLGVEMLVNSGTAAYTGEMSTTDWDKFKTRLVI